MFWLVYLLVLIGLLYVSLRNFPRHPVMCVAVTVCMMLAFSPVFTKYDIYEPLVLGFPLWFLVWFIIAALFIWIILFYTLIKLFPNNKELEDVWDKVAKRKEKGL